MKYFALLFISMFVSLQEATAQSDSLDCKAKYQQWEKFFNEHASITFMESAPELIGGLEALQKQLVYPQAGKQIDVEGRIFVHLIVDTTGVPQCIKVARGLQKHFDQAALQAVRKMEFRPATIRGKPIEAPYMLPVEFRIVK